MMSVGKWLSGQIRGQLLMRSADLMLQRRESDHAIDSAIQAALSAERQFEKIGEWQEQIRTLDTATMAFEMSGMWENAVQVLERKLAVTRRHSSKIQEALTLAGLANAYRVLGEPKKAIVAGEACVDLAGEIGGPAVLVGGAALAHTYLDLGLYEQTVSILDEAIRTAREEGSRRMLASLSGLLAMRGSALVGLREFGPAIESLTEARNLAQENGDKSIEALVLSSLGAAHFVVNMDLEESAKAYREALAIERELPRYRTNIAFTLIEAGKLEWFLGNIGSAITLIEEGIQLAIAGGNERTHAVGAARLGTIYSSIGQFERSKTCLNTAIEIHERHRDNLDPSDDSAVTSLDGIGLAYNQLQLVLVKSGDPIAAFATAERHHARALTALLRRRDGVVENPAYTIADLQHIAQESSTTYITYTPVWNFKLGDTRLDSMRELIVTVLGHDGTITTRLAPAAWFFDKILILSGNALTTQQPLGQWDVIWRPEPGRDPWEPWLRLLHSFLIEPISDLLPGNPEASVVIVPTGDLWRVPFAALLDKDNTFLVERHTIALASSVTTALEIKSRDRDTTLLKAGSVLAVGIESISAELEPLPEAQGEAADIVGIHGGMALLGDDATKSSFLALAPQYDIIHIATHGVIWHGDETRVPGGICLALEGSDDGVLTSREIAAQHWNADVVVLSGCYTGNGRLSADGLVGLSRSVLLAGSSMVIAALDPIPDASTRWLMRIFHARYRATGDKAGALREAMLAAIHETRPVYEWAPFVAIGERWRRSER